MASDGKLVNVVPEAIATTSAQKNSTQLEKWGIATKAGYQLVPNVLIQAQSSLEIDPVDLVILLNISLHWWGASSLPYPAPSRIAVRMGVSRRTIERRLISLEKRGFIERLSAKALGKGKPKVRQFDMSGLIKKLEIAALKGLAERNYAKSQQSSADIAG